MTNAIQDIEKLFRAISQPSIQTVENTIEISHYFNRQSKENRPDSLSDENNKCDTMNNVIPTPPQKAVLRKVVREGLQNEKNRRRTRLKRKCAAIRNGKNLLGCQFDFGKCQ